MTRQPTYFPTSARFRRWLEANHETAPELPVGFWKKSTSRLGILLESSAAGEKIPGYDWTKK